MDFKNKDISYFFKVIIPSIIVFFAFAIYIKFDANFMLEAYLLFGAVYAIDFLIASKKGESRKIIFIDPVTGLRALPIGSFWFCVKLVLYVLIIFLIAVFSFIPFIYGIIKFILALTKKSRESKQQEKFSNDSNPETEK